MPLSVLLSNWRASRAAMERLTEDLPRIIGVESVRAVKENFKLQGYSSGSGVAPWKARKESTNKAYDRGKNGGRYRSGKNKTYKGSVYSGSNPLLMQTHNMYNSIKYQRIGNQVQVGIDLAVIPYAKAMNKTRKFMPSDGEPPNLLILSRVKKKFEYEKNKAMAALKL